MFTNIGRRLAITNAVVVTIVILLTGAATYVALNQSLNREIDGQLRDRIRQYQTSNDTFDAGSPPITSAPEDDHEADEDDGHEDEEIAASGDTIVFTIDANGTTVSNSRGVDIEGLPIAVGVQRALSGHDDTRSVTVEHLGAMRVLTVPIQRDGRIVGAIQATRSLREHDRELGLIRWMTVAGTALGIACALPAGLFLARRAMWPIDAAFRRQQAFVADASHELRTPLTLIRANAEYAAMDTARPVAQVQPQISDILAEVERTDRLVDDLLVLARSDAGHVTLRPEHANVHTLVLDAVHQMGPLADAEQKHLIVEGERSLTTTLDLARVNQALRILLDNAIRHAEPASSIVVTVQRNDHQVLIRVHNDGTPIPPADLPRIFDRFYRSDASRSRSSGGTGLGLSIAKSLIEAHDGTITVTSSTESGTDATIRLPLRR